MAVTSPATDTFLAHYASTVHVLATASTIAAATDVEPLAVVVVARSTSAKSKYRISKPTGLLDPDNLVTQKLTLECTFL